MNDLMRVATHELARFLEVNLPSLGGDWWTKHVLNRLSFQQQRIAQERGHSTLQQLDCAALLRVLDQNWHELSGTLNLPREGRGWVKELQVVRNKWAHMPAMALPPSDTYRDADTLGRFLLMIGAATASLDAVEAARTSAVEEMSSRRSRAASAESEAESATSPNQNTINETTSGVDTPSNAVSLFQVGDLVALRSNPATILPILEVVSGGGELRYRVFQNNSKTTYFESQLQAPPGIVEERRVITAAELQARLTCLQVLSPSTTNLFSLRSGRVQFVPYQYRPVLKLIRSDRARLLVADEVGVGKTIEAGLVIKELRARTDLASVLIICPKALVAERKWFLEMKRFDEHFTALDGALLRHCLQESHLEGEWPEQYAKAILPFSLFDSDLLFGGQGRRAGQGLLTLDPPPKFDLVIVDEAHHIRNSDTYLHQGIRHFCDNAEAVLFLSATPVQLGSDDLYTLLNVLRPDLVIDHAAFEQMAAPNRHINAAVQHCRTALEGWQAEALRCMEETATTEWGRLFLRESPAFQAIYDRLQGDDIPDGDRVVLCRAIEDLYTFSPLINRTRRRDIGEFTTRKAETVTVEFTASQRQLHDELLDVVARILAYCHGQQNVRFMMTTIRRQSASCLYGLAPLLEDILAGKLNQLEMMEANDVDEESDLTFGDQVRADIARLIEQARHLDERDPKIDAFVRVLTDKSKMAKNKSLVFSTYRHTLAYLAKHVGRTGLRYGVIHGEVPDEERANLRRRFALSKEHDDALDVLLSSEVGCEGLDFQFCDFLVNYDLPWNPMRIEQRIGRIDRYGQTSETVAIVNFVTPGTVDADIYERCLWRIGVFQHAIGGNEEILGRVTQELHDIAESFDLTTEERAQRLRQLSDNGVRQIREEQELESKQAELFGLNVPKQSWQEDIEAAENQWLSPAALQHAVSAYLSARLGTETEHLLGEQSLKTLRLSQEARLKLLDDYKSLPRSVESVPREWERWLKGGQPTLSVTFDQKTAAENPKAVHFSVMHPLMRQAARIQPVHEPGFAAVMVESAEIASGTHSFAIYRWRKQGVKLDEVLVAVVDDASVEKALFGLLRTAIDDDRTYAPSEADVNALDALHHAKWIDAQAAHIADNRQQVEHRVQSLTVSHRARCKAIEDQIVRATNDRIRLMKQSELGRANADFSRRMDDLQQAANSGDIHATAVLIGTIAIHSRTK